jgi:hypothetical protein
MRIVKAWSDLTIADKGYLPGQRRQPVTKGPATLAGCIEELKALNDRLNELVPTVDREVDSYPYRRDYYLAGWKAQEGLNAARLVLEAYLEDKERGR